LLPFSCTCFCTPKPHAQSCRSSWSTARDGRQAPGSTLWPLFGWALKGLVSLIGWWRCQKWVHNVSSNPMALRQFFGKKKSQLVHAIRQRLVEPLLGTTAINHGKYCLEALLPKAIAIIGSVASEHRKRFPDQFQQAHFRDAQTKKRSAGTLGCNVSSDTPDWLEEFGNNMPSTASENY